MTPEVPTAPLSAAYTVDQQRYLDLLVRMLTREGFTEFREVHELQFFEQDVQIFGPEQLNAITAWLFDWMRRLDMAIVRKQSKDPDTGVTILFDSYEWPGNAETMVGRASLHHIANCIASVVRDRIPGDVIECGVWRGGATIMMRAALNVLGATDRTVWVADSFEGLPPPHPDEYPNDSGDEHHTFSPLAISLEEVRANFRRYGLLDDTVRFLPGWFRDTLPGAPLDALAVVRIDGDMYESTMQAIEALYPKLSIGGFLICDDYGALPAAAAAIDDYRASHGIDEPIEQVNNSAVAWRRRS